MLDHRPAVSARGVLDGDPAALASLCDLRGPSVLAYCRAVCGPEDSVEAAAATFAAFRSTAVQASRPLTLNPDALLLAKARQAAAERAPDPAAGTPRREDPICPEVPRLLAGAAQGSLDPSDRHHLRRHLARCVACRAAQNAQREAERAYVHPPAGTLTPIARQAIIAALRNAVPGAGPACTPGPSSAPAPASPPGPRPRAGVAPTAGREAGARPLPPTHQPTRPVNPFDNRQGPSPSDHGLPAVPAADGQLPVQEPFQPPPGTAGAKPGGTATGRRETVSEAPTGVVPVDQIAAALGYGARPAAPAAIEDITRPRRPPGRGPSRRLGDLRPRLPGRLPGVRVLAPAAVLVVALLVILGAAGVFSSSAPRSSSPGSTGSASPAGSGAPATTPPATGPHSLAAHRARLRAARRRRAARARARAAAAAAAANASGGVAKTGSTSQPPGGRANPAGVAALDPPAPGGPPAAPVLATPVADSPPGPAGKAPGGYRVD